MDDWKKPTDAPVRLRAWVRVVESREGSLTAASRALGVSQPTLSRVLSGKNSVGQKLERALCAYLQVSIERLVSAPPGAKGDHTERRAVPHGLEDQSRQVVVERPDRYHFARDVIQQLVEDGICQNEAEAAGVVGRIAFLEPEDGSNAMDLYRAAVRSVLRERRPWKLFGEREVLSDDDL